MTSLQTDSPQQIFLVTYLMIVPSSPYNLIIIAISNSNLSDCSFQLLLPVITFSHTAISLEFSPCKILEPCEPVMSQTSLREINTKCPTAGYFFQPPSNFYASPPPLFNLFYPPKNASFKTALCTEIKCYFTVERYLTRIRRKAFLYYHSISVRDMVMYKKKTVTYNTSLNLNIDLLNCVILCIEVFASI